MDESSSDAPRSTLTRIAKIIGLIAIVSSIFGVSYQKGMIIKMQMGNLSGNYDVREVINFEPAANVFNAINISIAC